MSQAATIGYILAAAKIARKRDLSPALANFHAPSQSHLQPLRADTGKACVNQNNRTGTSIQSSRYCQRSLHVHTMPTVPRVSPSCACSTSTWTASLAHGTCERTARVLTKSVHMYTVYSKAALSGGFQLTFQLSGAACPRLRVQRIARPPCVIAESVLRLPCPPLLPPPYQLNQLSVHQHREDREGWVAVFREKARKQFVYAVPLIGRD